MQFMKLEALKNSIGGNLLALGGWVTALMFIHYIPFCNIEKQSGYAYVKLGFWFILCGITSAVLWISIIFTTIELCIKKFCNLQYKSKFLSENYIYSCFFEFGLLLYVFYIIWLFSYSNNLLPVVGFICAYIIFKIIEYKDQRRKNK